jgi:hypothetical protein
LEACSVPQVDTAIYRGAGFAQIVIHINHMNVYYVIDGLGEEAVEKRRSNDP